MKNKFSSILFIFFSVSQFYGYAQTIGTVFSDSFNGTSLQTYWRLNAPSVTVAVNDKLIVTGGDSSFHNFLEYKEKRLPYEKLNFSVIVVPQEKTSNSYGISLFADSDSILYGSSLEVTLDLTNGSNSGKIMVGYNHQTPLSVSTALTFQPGDTIRFSINRNGWNIEATAHNFTSNNTVQTTMINSSGRGSGGFWRLAFLGGSHHITHVLMDVASRQSPRNVVIGNSITAGAGASAETKRYVNLLFNQDAIKFETIAMPSIKSADVLKYVQEAVDLQPQYALLSVGVNDRNQFVDTNLFRSNYDTLVRKLKENQITPVLLTLVASGFGFVENTSPRYNGIISRIGLAYNVKVIDINPLLKNASGILSTSYSTGRVHPNDSGHYIIANHIFQSAPELNGIQTLPLKLHSFEVEKINDHVQLQWVTSEETNLLKFEVERSNDAVRFYSTASLFPKQIPGTAETKYTVTDKPSMGSANWYYRLKMIHTDWSYEYSLVKKLINNQRTTEQLQLYPNPASNYVIIRLPALQHQNQLKTEVTDSYGRVVISLNERAVSGGIHLSTAQLAAGIYFVRITDEANKVTQAKLVIH
jgi:lysophospholipase L1-like esterase